MDLAALVVAFVGLVLIVFSILGDELQRRRVRLILGLAGTAIFAGSVLFLR